MKRDRSYPSHFKPIPREELLTPEEETALVRAWQVDGDTMAMKHLCERHKRFVYSLAKKYAWNSGMQSHLKDMKQEAMLAFVEQAANFDGSQGVRLNSYVRYHITGVLGRYVMDNITATRLGTNIDDKRAFWVLRRAAAEYEASAYGRLTESRLQYMSRVTGISEKVLRRMEPRILGHDINLDRAHPLSPKVEGHANRDPRAFQEDWRNFADPAPSAASTIQKEQQETIAQQLVIDFRQDASKAEAFILDQRILNTDKPLSLDRIAKHLGTSKRRVQTAEKNILRGFKKALAGLGIATSEDVSAVEEAFTQPGI